MARADLHNHLGINGANPGFDETVNIAYSKLGNGGIFGIADSNDFRFERFINQKGKYHRIQIDEGAIQVPEKDIFVVKCQEMFTEKGHILAAPMPIGKIVKTKDTKKAMFTAKTLGASLVAVHPFYDKGIGKLLEENPQLLREFASMEVYNGSAEFSFPFVLPRNANRKALDFYVLSGMDKLNTRLGMLSATDGHSAEVVGKCYTELPDFDFSRDLISYFDNALRSVKTLDKLHMKPNKMDAANHAFNIAFRKKG